MSVQYMGIPIWVETDELCTKMSCPAQPGRIFVKYDQNFPGITPPVR